MVHTDDCFGSIWIDDICSCVLNGLTLVVIEVIGLFGIAALRQAPNIPDTQRLLFICALFSSTVTCLGAIGQNVMCILMGVRMEWMLTLCLVGYQALLQCVLGAFVHRLFHTFIDTPLAVAPCQKRVIFGLYLLLIAISVTIYMVALFSRNQLYSDEEYFVNSETPWFPLFLNLSDASWFLIFVVLSIWTVCAFCRRLLLTAKAHSQWTHAKGLDSKQHQIIDVSAKYLSLFLFAILSTVVNFAIIQVCVSHALNPSILMGVDCCLNLFGLYLQYPFSSILYYRRCGRLDYVCRWMMTKRLGQQDQAIKVMRARSHMNSAKTVDEKRIAENLDSYQGQTVTEMSNPSSICSELSTRIEYREPTTTITSIASNKKQESDLPQEM